MLPCIYLSIDPRGELAYEENTYGYGGVPSHIVEVLTEQASNAYKDFLRKKQISYIIAGKDQIDYEVMLDKFYNLFHIKRMMVGGGGTINWSLIQNGLVDEVSVILALSQMAIRTATDSSLQKNRTPALKKQPFNLNPLKNWNTVHYGFVIL